MKKVMYAIFVIGLLLLVGCAGDKGPAITRTTPFVGGRDSLEINFVAGEPPEEALDNNQLPFVVTLSVENKGEWDVPQGAATLELRGFRAADFNNPETLKSPDEDLNKKYIDSDGNVIPGTFTHVTFDGFSYMGEVQATNEFPIIADICYKYGTKAQLDLCYLKDLTATDNEVCDVRGSKPVYSSSAPVSVENVREELGGTNKISFTFDVMHRGSGLLAKLDTDCNAEDKRIDKNVVWIEVDTDLPGLSCSGLTEGTGTNGFVTLYTGKRSVRCTQDNPGDGDYIKKANVILKYDYKETKKTSILIKHIVE